MEVDLPSSRLLVVPQRQGLQLDVPDVPVHRPFRRGEWTEVLGSRVVHGVDLRSSGTVSPWFPPVFINLSK